MSSRVEAGQQIDVTPRGAVEAGEVPGVLPFADPAVLRLYGQFERGIDPLAGATR